MISEESTTPDLVELTRGAFEAVNRRDLDALMQMLEDDCRRLHARYMRQRDALATVANTLGARDTRVRRAS